MVLLRSDRTLSFKERCFEYNAWWKPAKRGRQKSHEPTEREEKLHSHLAQRYFHFDLSPVTVSAATVRGEALASSLLVVVCRPGGHCRHSKLLTLHSVNIKQQTARVTSLMKSVTVEWLKTKFLLRNLSLLQCKEVMQTANGSLLNLKKVKTFEGKRDRKPQRSSLCSSQRIDCVQTSEESQVCTVRNWNSQHLPLGFDLRTTARADTPRQQVLPGHKTLHTKPSVDLRDLLAD